MRHYATVTFAYWAFTLTDGALRMLVLLHLHQLGMDAISLALIFLLYELAGVLANFAAGWVGSRFGLKTTLWQGLGLQIVAVGVLAWQEGALSVLLVACMQGLSGIAKDLTKVSAKSYLKVFAKPSVSPHRLLGTVAMLTGSKNTLKGVGFFLGAYLLQEFGFRGANLVMLALLATALLASITTLPPRIGKSKQPPRFRDLWVTDARLFRLSVARLFLFASRDAWFAIALPLYLVDQLNWSQAQAGVLLASWVIAYGVVQVLAPQLLRHISQSYTRQLQLICASLLVPLLALVSLLLAEVEVQALQIGLVILLALFGFLFALNSALHSFLILEYSERDEVAMRVGFYYSANACGRLLGTLVSGLAYAWGGLFVASVIASASLVVLSLGATHRLRQVQS